MISIQNLWNTTPPDSCIKHFQYVKAITIEYLIIFFSKNTFAVNFRSLVDESSQTITFEFFKNRVLSEIKLNELGTHFYLLTEDGLFANIPIFIFSEDSIIKSWKDLVKADDPIKYLQSLQSKAEPTAISEFIFGKTEEFKTKKSFSFTIDDIQMVSIKNLITEIHVYEYLGDEISFREKVERTEQTQIGPFKAFEKWIDIHEQEYQAVMAKGGYIIFISDDSLTTRAFQFPFEIALFKIIKGQKSSMMLLQNTEGAVYYIVLERVAENRIDSLFEKYSYSAFEPRRMGEFLNSFLYFDQATVREDTKFVQYQPENRIIQIFSDGNIEQPSEIISCHMSTPSLLIEWLYFFLVFYITEDELEIRVLSKKILSYQADKGLYSEGRTPISRKSRIKTLKYLEQPFQDLESGFIVTERIKLGYKITDLKLDQSSLLRNRSLGSYDLTLNAMTTNTICSVTICLKKILDNNWALLGQQNVSKERFLITDYVLSDFYTDYTQKLSGLKDSLAKAENYNILFDLEIYQLIGVNDKNPKFSEIYPIIVRFLKFKQISLRKNILHFLVERMFFDSEITIQAVLGYSMLAFFAIFRDIILSEYSAYFSSSFHEELMEELKQYSSDLVIEGNKLDSIILSLKIIFRILQLAQEKCKSASKGFLNSFTNETTIKTDYHLYFEKYALKFNKEEEKVNPYENFSLWLSNSVISKSSFLTPSYQALLLICEDDSKMTKWNNVFDLVNKLEYGETLYLLSNGIYKAKILNRRSVHMLLSYLDRAFECSLGSKNLTKKDIETSLELFVFYHCLCTGKDPNAKPLENQHVFDKIQNKMLKKAKDISQNAKKCDPVGITYTFGIVVHLHSLLTASEDKEKLKPLEETVASFIVELGKMNTLIDYEKILYLCLSKDNEVIATLIVNAIKEANK